MVVLTWYALRTHTAVMSLAATHDSSRFGMTVSWSPAPGERCCIEVDGLMNDRAALEQAVDFALDCGWSPPARWQFWRWGERAVPGLREAYKQRMER